MIVIQLQVPGSVITTGRWEIYGCVGSARNEEQAAGETMMVSGFHVNKNRVRIFPWAFGSHNKAIAIVSTYIDKKRE